MSENNCTGSITCGSFSASAVGWNRWEIRCNWMPDFLHEVNCTQAKVRDLLIRIQAENRRPVVVK